MELRVLEQSKSQLIFELPGADHTFCNALKNELWQEKGVEIATYAIKHPLIPVPKFIVQSKSGDAKAALLSANVNLQKNFKALRTTLKKI